MSAEPEAPHVCPVSGLPVLRKPEWTDISFGTDYRANVSIIGKSILFSRSKGRAKRRDVENLFRLNSSILAEEMNGNPYVYIEDFSNLKGASFRARTKYIDNIKKREQIRGVVYFGLSPLLKMSVKLGKCINFFKFGVKIADDYPQAVRLALDMLQGGEIKDDDSPVRNEYRSVSLPGKKGKSHDIVSHPDWSFGLDGYSVKIEVIDGRIIHSLSTGYMEEKHIETIKTMRRKACDAMCPKEGFEYFIAGVRDFKGVNRRARKLYMASMKEWHAHKPFRMYILYGSNRLMRTATNLARPFMPFKVRTAKDLEGALKLISEEESGRAEAQARSASGFSRKEAASPPDTEQYVDELLQYLGAVNWETGGFDHNYNMEIDPSHSFRPVFEALELIKAELTELLQGRRKAEEALEESEKYLQHIMDSVKTGVIVIDPESHTILSCNSYALDLIGAKEEEVIGHMCHEYICPAERGRCPITDLKQIVDHSERVLMGAGGKRIPIIKNAVQINHQGKSLLIESFIDDTEGMKAKKELKESEEKYREFADSLPQTVYETDSKGNLTFSNRNAYEFFGYTQSEIKEGLNALQMLVPEDRESAGRNIQRSMSGEKIGGVEYTALRKDGGTFPAIIHSIPIINDNKPVGLRGIIIDLTKQKRTEDELRESERKLSTLITNLPGIAYRCKNDKNWTMEFMSNGTLELTGYEPAHLLGNKGPSYSDLIHPDDRRSVWDRVQKALSEKRAFSLMYRIIALSGDVKWVSERGMGVYSEGGELLALEGFIADITEQKIAEIQLRQSQKMEAVGTLAGGIAHDFNNLLTTIIGYADLSMARQDGDGALKEEISEIKKAARRAASLTSQILAFSRKQVIKPRIMDFNEELEDTNKMLQRVIGENIELVAEKGEDLWKIEADPGQINQIIVNLAVNARDAMPEGGVLTIETSNVELKEDYFRAQGIEGSAGQYVMLAVSDTGIGMDKETRSRIFEPFFTTKEIGSGTGLGLSTVYGIVKQNRGFVWAYSEPGTGTALKVYLPRAEADNEPNEREKASPVSLKGNDTILVVEDEKMLRHLAVKVLRRYGYEVLEAENGESALNICEEYESPIHMVLTDVVMPGMNGHELAKRLDSITPKTRVLFMSGYTDKAIVKHHILSPQLHFLQKPFKPMDLAIKVREVLDNEN